MTRVTAWSSASVLVLAKDFSDTRDKSLHEIEPTLGGTSTRLLESVFNREIEDHVSRLAYEGRKGLEILEQSIGKSIGVRSYILHTSKTLQNVKCKT